MTLQERLKNLRRDLSLSVDKMASDLSEKGFNIASKTITGYESGLRQPSLSFLTGLVEVFEVNPYWVLTGTGSKFYSSEDSSNMPGNVDLTNTIFIPIIDIKASAGHGALIEAEKENTKDFISFTKQWLSAITSTSAKYLVGFIVKGDSMQGEINDGDIIIVNTQLNEMSNDGTYAVNIDDKMYVKTLQQRPGNKVRVISANPKYEPYTVDLNTEYFNIIGKVIWSGGRKDIC